MSLEKLYRKTFNAEMPCRYERAMIEAIEKLNESDRWILEERYLKCRTLEDIAQEQGKTRQAVEQREREARRMLVARLYAGKGDRIENLGLSKGAYQALMRAGITSIKRLDEMAKRGSLRTVKGIGLTKEANIMASLIIYKEKENGKFV